MEGPHLSWRGRLILVNSVLTSLPLYYMSFFFVPQWVIYHIDRLRRAFFWNGDRSVAVGQCLISWEVLCTPCSVHGLGKCQLRDFNIFLLTKWWWKLLLITIPPGWKWLTLITINAGGFLSAWEASGPSTPFWCGVLRTIQAFKLGFRLTCSQGSLVKFWKDC